MKVDIVVSGIFGSVYVDGESIIHYEGVSGIDTLGLVLFKFVKYLRNVREGVEFEGIYFHTGKGLAEVLRHSGAGSRVSHNDGAYIDRLLLDLPCKYFSIVGGKVLEAHRQTFSKHRDVVQKDDMVDGLVEGIDDLLGIEDKEA